MPAQRDSKRATRSETAREPRGAKGVTRAGGGCDQLARCCRPALNVIPGRLGKGQRDWHQASCVYSKGCDGCAGASAEECVVVCGCVCVVGCVCVCVCVCWGCMNQILGEPRRVALFSSLLQNRGTAPHPRTRAHTGPGYNDAHSETAYAGEDGKRRRRDAGPRTELSSRASKHHAIPSSAVPTRLTQGQKQTKGHSLALRPSLVRSVTVRDSGVQNPFLPYGKGSP
jgi:hypothetical protein